MQSTFKQPLVQSSVRWECIVGIYCLVVSLLLVPSIGVADNIEEGKKIAFDRKKGNCLACHVIEGGESPGDIGPPLVAIKARFPEKRALRDKIWDATVSNPNTIMVPFGKNRVLTEDEIDKVVAFVMSL